RSNDELLSFNHIASHDLQEPLRKIQMFISRFSAEDISNLSESGQTYLSRIQATSNRAQKLIDDLLVYSRISRNESKPERTDLNLLLENAQVDLSEEMEEKQAVIVSDELPSIKVIPQQMQQLFLNLISNSLKYA